MFSRCTVLKLNIFHSKMKILDLAVNIHNSISLYYLEHKLSLLSIQP